MADKIVTVTSPSVFTGDTLASYNVYTDKPTAKTLIGTMTPAEAAAGKTFSIPDSLNHNISAYPVGTTTGEYNAPSNIVVVDLSVALPAAPTLLADAGGETNPDTEINLTWTKSVDGVMTNYRVYIGGVLQQTFGDVALGTLTGLTAETAYNNITVRAWNGTTESADSNSINVTTEAAASAYPTNNYTSDFSAGVDGFTASNMVQDGNIDAISDGVTSLNDVLRQYQSAATTQGQINKNCMNIGVPNRLRFKYYIPTAATNPDIDGFVVFDGTATPAIDLKRSTDPSPAVLGTWTDYEVVYTPTQVLLRIKLYDGSNTVYTGTNSVTSNLFYIKDVIVDY